MRGHARWGAMVALGVLLLSGPAFGVTLPSGDDTMDNMAVNGPIIQAVPETSALLVVVMWIGDRTKDSVLTIQEMKSRKFIAEVRRVYDPAHPDVPGKADIWVDKCFAESGSACGGVGTHFEGTPEALQEMIVQRIQKHEKAAQAQGSGDPPGVVGPATH